MQPWLLTPSSPHLKPGKRLWKLRLFKTSGCQKKGPNAACHFLPLGFPILPCFCLELPGAHHGQARWRVYPFRMETSEQEKSPPWVPKPAAFEHFCHLAWLLPFPFVDPARAQFQSCCHFLCASSVWDPEIHGPPTRPLKLPVLMATHRRPLQPTIPTISRLPSEKG